jgi:hypothetical protein
MGFDGTNTGMTDSKPTDLVSLAVPVDPERDAIESRLSDGLVGFLKQHDRCNIVRDADGKITSMGAEIYSGELDSHRRQCAQCAECSAMFAGPSYAWLNRGVRLTRFGQLLKHGSTA